jgi:hypothetical protein
MEGVCFNTSQKGREACVSLNTWPGPCALYEVIGHEFQETPYQIINYEIIRFTFFVRRIANSLLVAELYFTVGNIWADICDVIFPAETVPALSPPYLRFNYDVIDLIDFIDVL